MSSLPKPGDTFVVMYHYVDRRQDLRVDGLSPDEFVQQVRALRDHYGLLTREQWSETVSGHPIPGALLTFDDGLSGHFRVAANALQDLGAFAKFFVCSDPLVEGRALKTHLAHYILARLEASTALEMLIAAIKARTGLLPPPSDAQGTSYALRREDPSKITFKRLVNYAQDSPSVRYALLDVAARLDAWSESDFVREWYMSREDIESLHVSGFEVGSHGKSHLLLSDLAGSDLKDQVADFLKPLSAALPDSTNAFCYPFGGPQSYTAETIDAVQAAGYNEAFVVRPAPIGRCDLHVPLALPRYDCAALP